eukprot:6272303-Pyramimonas_sp.AAC.1
MGLDEERSGCLKACDQVVQEVASHTPSTAPDAIQPLSIFSAVRTRRLPCAPIWMSSETAAYPA